MKRKRHGAGWFCILGWSFWASCVLASCAWAQETVQTYPAPEGEAVSGVYSVKVNGQSVDVYSAQCEYFEGEYYFAYFDFSGKVTIEVRAAFPLDKVQIQPERFGVQTTQKETECVTLVAEKPFQISFEPNGRIRPLILFGNELETDPPKPDDPNVIYFAPGVHRPGKITLTDNQTLYLAGGAVVKGGVFASGKNITIRGRGVLAGEESPRFSGPCFSPLHCVNCQNLTIRDVILRNPWNWTVVPWSCDGVRIEGLKICGARMINDDAVDLVNTRNVEIRNCFFRTQDDSIAVKGMDEQMRPCENILVEDCVFWTDLANIFRIGYECQAQIMRNIHVRNTDVLYYSIHDREPTEYWTNTIFFLQPSRDMPMENLRFENIRIRSNGDNIVLLAARPMRCWYGEVQLTPGSLKNVSFDGIHVFGTQGKFHGSIHITGESEVYNVDGMKFREITYFGQPITRSSECVTIGPFTKNIDW